MSTQLCTEMDIRQPGATRLVSERMVLGYRYAMVLERTERSGRWDVHAEVPLDDPRLTFERDGWEDWDDGVDGPYNGRILTPFRNEYMDCCIRHGPDGTPYAWCLDRDLGTAEDGRPEEWADLMEELDGYLVRFLTLADPQWSIDHGWLEVSDTPSAEVGA